MSSSIKARLGPKRDIVEIGPVHNNSRSLLLSCGHRTRRSAKGATSKRKWVRCSVCCDASDMVEPASAERAVETLNRWYLQNGFDHKAILMPTKRLERTV